MLRFFRRYGFKSILSVSLALFTILPLPADIFVGTNGQLTFSTPFDQKIYSTGIFKNHSGESPVLFGNLDLEQIFNICRTFRYVSDSDGDYWQSAEETEAKHSGDCEDKAIWLFSRLKMNGYESIRLVIGKYRPVDRQYHVWVTYQDPLGNEYLLDPTKQKHIWTMGQFSSDFYRPIFSFDGVNRYRHTA